MNVLPSAVVQPMNILWKHLPFGPGANLPIYDFGESNFAVARWDFAVARWDASGTHFLEWNLCPASTPLEWSAPMTLSNASGIIRRLLASPISLPNAVVTFNVASADTIRIGLCRTAAEFDPTEAPTWFETPNALGALRRFVRIPTRYERALENDENDEAEAGVSTK